MSWLDSLFLAYRTVRGDSASFPVQPAINFVGATVTDDPVNKQTTVTVGAGGTAGGDLSGTYPDPTVVAIQGFDVSSSAPSDGQALIWSSGSSAYIPGEAGVSSPTGTGFVHVTAGVQDGASKLVENADVASAAAIAFSKLAGSAGCSVLGAAASGVTVAIAAITAGSNDTVLKRSAGSLAFASIVNADVDTAAAIAYSKLADGSACSVLGRHANSSGANASIAAGSNNTALQRIGDDLIFTTIANASIDAAAAIAYSKLADGSACSVLGRSANSTGANASIAAGSDGLVLKRASGALAFASIVNADVDAAAAIAGTKVAPAFGSQNITFTGYMAIGATPASSGDIRCTKNTTIIAVDYSGTAMPVVKSDATQGIYIGSQTDTYAVYLQSSSGGIGCLISGTQRWTVNASKVITTNSGKRDNVTNSTDANYTILVTDEIISVPACTAARTMTLPASPTTGDRYSVSDTGGTAATYPITIAGSGANVCGGANIQITLPYGAAELFYNGTQWALKS